jgi:hypothetical protein
LERKSVEEELEKLKRLLRLDSCSLPLLFLQSGFSALKGVE